jgi:hypothetical protein
MRFAHYLLLSQLVQKSFARLYYNDFMRNAGLHFLLDFTPVFNLGLAFRFVTENNI